MKFDCGDGPITKKTLIVLNHLFIFVFKCVCRFGSMNPGCSIQPSSEKQEGSPKTALGLKYEYTLTIILAQISSN